MKNVFSVLQDFISNNFGWFLILAVNVYLLQVIYLAFSKYGTIRLGGKNAVPDFSRLSWFAMLFSAGMGIGILFWNVAEQIYRFIIPPCGGGSPEDNASMAMKISFLH